MVAKFQSECKASYIVKKLVFHISTGYIVCALHGKSFNCEACTCRPLSIMYFLSEEFLVKGAMSQYF